MLRPTLIVGIGSSGLFIVEQVQKLFYETFQRNSIPIVKFLYIETDGGKSAERTPAGDDVIPIRTFVKDLGVTLSVLKADDPRRKMDWVPAGLESRLSSINIGAGGVRPGGRLALWEMKNFGNVYSQIENAWRTITAPETADGVPRELIDQVGEIGTTPIVYVVGTLCGGTGSGMFIDIGYLIRERCQLGLGGSLHGIFLTPPSGGGMDVAFANTWGALKEVDYYREPENNYEEVWPNHVIARNDLPPYSVLYLVSPEYADASLGGFASIEGLYKVVGLKLFCDLLGMSDFRESVLADGKQAGFGFYGTWGISGAIYPKYSISELVACQIGAELCTRWLDEFHWRDYAGKDSPISEPDIFEESLDFLDDVIGRAKATLLIRDGGGLENQIEKDVDDFINKINPSPREYFANSFTAASQRGYHAVTCANVASARDVMIRELRSKVAEVINQKQNIAYGIKYLRGIEAAINATLTFYEASGVPTNPAGWQELVDREIGEVLFRPHRFLKMTRDVLSDRLRNLCIKLEIHVLADILRQIRSAIQEGGLTTIGDDRVVLPSLTMLGELRDKVDEAHNRLSEREKKIQGEVSDNSVPVLRVWHSNGFESDCGDLKTRFQLERPVASVDQVSRQPLFDLLDSSDGATLFDVLRLNYQSLLTTKLPDVDVIAEATRRLPQMCEYAKRALTGLLRLERGGKSGEPGIPRFVIGSDRNRINQLIDGMTRLGMPDFQPNHSREIKCLRHAVIFYDEKGNVSPLRDLKSREQMAQAFEQPPRDRTGQPIATEQVWQSLRLAYGTEQKLLAKRASEAIRFLREFCFEWRRQPAGEWEAVSKRAEFGNVPLSAGNPPRYEVKIPMKPISKIVLNADDPKALAVITDDRQIFERLHDEVVSAVKRVGVNALISLFNENVRSMLESMHGVTYADESGVFYFGRDEDGIIYKMAKGEF